MTPDPAGERLHPRVERAYRTDEARARAVLYGPSTRSGSVAHATPRGRRHSVQHCTDPFNNDDPAAGTGEAV